MYVGFFMYNIKIYTAVHALHCHIYNSRRLTIVVHVVEPPNKGHVGDRNVNSITHFVLCRQAMDVFRLDKR